MISVIRQFFDKYVAPSRDSGQEISGHALQIATAALLIEMMRADTEISADEQEIITRTMQSKFDLNEEEAAAVMNLAEDEIWKSTGYYEFTSLMNRSLSYPQKVKVIEHLWEVAFADNILDKHEEYMVRRIADLIYVPHRDFIDAKLRVKHRNEAQDRGGNG